MSYSNDYPNGTLTITGLDIGKSFSFTWLIYAANSDPDLSSGTGYTTVKSIVKADSFTGCKIKSGSKILIATESTVTLSLVNVDYYLFSAYQV